MVADVILRGCRDSVSIEKRRLTGEDRPPAGVWSGMERSLSRTGLARNVGRPPVRRRGPRGMPTSSGCRSSRRLRKNSASPVRSIMNYIVARRAKVKQGSLDRAYTGREVPRRSEHLCELSCELGGRLPFDCVRGDSEHPSTDTVVGAFVGAAHDTVRFLERILPTSSTRAADLYGPKSSNMKRGSANTDMNQLGRSIAHGGRSGVRRARPEVPSSSFRRSGRARKAGQRVCLGRRQREEI